MTTERASSAATGPIRRALLASLRATKVAPQDEGAVALAKRLASLLDESTPLSTYTEPLQALDRLVAAQGDAEQKRALRRVTDALGEHSVASDLGPKYLATLTALGLTPAARGAKGGGGGVGTGSSKLDELRERREQQRSGAS